MSRIDHDFSEHPVHSRIYKVLSAPGKSITTICNEMGLNYTTIWDSWISRKAYPRADLLAKFCKKFNTSANWILFGQGPQSLSVAINGGENQQQNSQNGATKEAATKMSQLEEAVVNLSNAIADLAARNKILEQEKEELQELLKK